MLHGELRRHGPTQESIMAILVTYGAWINSEISVCGHFILLLPPFFFFNYVLLAYLVMYLIASVRCLLVCKIKSCLHLCKNFSFLWWYAYPPSVDNDWCYNYYYAYCWKCTLRFHFSCTAKTVCACASTFARVMMVCVS